MTREEIIDGLLGIHAVTCNYKGDQVILHSMPMPKLTAILYGAAELLKVEAPRVMTFEELRHAEVFWIERKGLYGCYAALKGTFGNTYFPYVMGADPNDRNDGARRYIVRIADYGKTWRCWTGQATEEQMEETPWDD